MYRGANLNTLRNAVREKRHKAESSSYAGITRIRFKGPGEALFPCISARLASSAPVFDLSCGRTSFYLTARGLSRKGGREMPLRPSSFFTLHFSLLLIKPSPGGRCPSAHTGADEGEPCGVVFRFLSLSFCDVKGRGRRFKTRSFSLLEKERFLESKEKGAPVRVEWLQIGIRRPGFTPPLRSSPVYGRLPGRNRGKLWSYPAFFRRLRGWVSGRGGADWYSLYRGARLPSRAHGTALFRGARRPRRAKPPMKPTLIRPSVPTGAPSPLEGEGIRNHRPQNLPPSGGKVAAQPPDEGALDRTKSQIHRTSAPSSAPVCSLGHLPPWRGKV